MYCTSVGKMVVVMGKLQSISVAHLCVATCVFGFVELSWVNTV